MRVFLTTIFALALPFFVFGQALNIDEVRGQLDISTTPSYPGPNEQVTMRVQNFSLDLENATISWYLDGSLKKQEKGGKDFTFVTGNLGSYQTIRVSVSGSKGSASKTVVISVADIDLLWRGVGYTPPFYKGRTGFAYQGKVEIVALPHFFGSNGLPVPKESVQFTWRQNNTIIGSASGLGRNTFTLPSSTILRPQTILLEASTASGQTAQKSLVLEAETPQVLLYEDSPLYGTYYNKALGTVSLEKEEITLIAEPFFFSSINNRKFGVDFSWSVNGEKVSGAFGESLTLRKTEGLSGTTLVSLVAEHITQALQTARGNVQINF